MRRATNATTAGRRYLDLQREARRAGRPTDELIQLYALECFLDRLTSSPLAEKFVLKGGVLLAALEARRPTRDIDFAAQALNNSADEIREAICEIAQFPSDDGIEFDSAGASAEVIREEDDYSGVRVTLSGALSRAAIRLHVDVNVGDPIWPEPRLVTFPRILGGTLVIRGYPLEMVLAEKIVTAIARGSANTRWRDFVDIVALVRRHPIAATTLQSSMDRVAQYRGVEMNALETALAGYAELAQQRWLAWLKKNRLEITALTDFSAALQLICEFSDPVISGSATGKTWDPVRRSWVDRSNIGT